MHPATILAQLDGFEDPTGALVPALQLGVSSRPPGAEAASHYARSGNSAADRLTTEGPGSLCPPGLIRLSVGLEHPGDLIADLAQALRS